MSDSTTRLLRLVSEAVGFDVTGAYVTRGSHVGDFFERPPADPAARYTDFDTEAWTRFSRLIPFPVDPGELVAVVAARLPPVG
jgi:hypothetical protein